MGISLTDHAHQRCAQRNVSYEEICFIVENGARVYNAGSVFCQMRENCIPDDVPPNHPIRRLVGATVVLAQGGCVLTVYRDEKAFKKDRQKEKYNWKRSRQRDQQDIWH